MFKMSIFLTVDSHRSILTLKTFCTYSITSFLFIANISFQSCRVNFNYSDAVCDNMIDKSINDINCVSFREKQKASPTEFIHLYSDHSQVLNDTTWKNGTAILPPGSNATIFFDITELEELVCQAEIDSQKLDTKLNLITAPFGNIITTTIIL